ncbi:MAG: type II toxin-antitoxin system VapC family toxin [Phycisphaerae bacterium]
MKTVFADTFHYAAIISPKDPYHGAARLVSQQLFGQIVTTEFVLMELGNGFGATALREQFAAFAAFLRSDSDTVVVPASSELFRAGLELFASRPDKERSLTDCTSFVVMRDRAIAGASTVDKHFEQAGFKALLR